ncbi:MAG: hypothetical protein FWC87_15740 [Acidimicrobiaceae bacterium]|nr:hypothetical protein [Acidimicrobiaceae bacterium]
MMTRPSDYITRDTFDCPTTDAAPCPWNRPIQAAMELEHKADELREQARALRLG